MRKVFEKNIVSGILFICIITIGSCNISKKLGQKNADWTKSAYIDSVMIKMPRVEILSDELKKMLDTLIQEASIYEPMKEFPNYNPYILASILPNSQIIEISVLKGYIMAFLFPGTEDSHPYYPYIYPLTPSRLGKSIYKGYSIVYHSSMQDYAYQNTLDRYDLIKVEQDSVQLTAYATRNKKGDEWIYVLMPSVTLYCEVVGNKLIFQRFEYDDGSIKYVE